MKRLIITALGIAIGVGMAAAAIAAGESATKSVTGTLEDSYCYSLMGAHGASHRKCALECAKKGIPVALVEKDSGKIYIVLPPKNASPYPDDVLNKMEDEVTITGKVASKGGVDFITAESVK
jgi:ABC-type antimicrobial peptide transport system permease subunit